MSLEPNVHSGWKEQEYSSSHSLFSISVLKTNVTTHCLKLFWSLASEQTRLQAEGFLWNKQIAFFFRTELQWKVSCRGVNAQKQKKVWYQHIPGVSCFPANQKFKKVSDPHVPNIQFWLPQQKSWMQVSKMDQKKLHASWKNGESILKEDAVCFFHCLFLIKNYMAHLFQNYGMCKIFHTGFRTATRCFCPQTGKFLAWHLRKEIENTIEQKITTKTTWRRQSIRIMDMHSATTKWNFEKFVFWICTKSLHRFIKKKEAVLLRKTKKYWRGTALKTNA